MESLPQPSIAIAVLTYNRARYLGQMLESILAQSYRNFTVTVYDNASTDNTLTILVSIMSSTPRTEGGFGTPTTQFPIAPMNIFS